MKQISTSISTFSNLIEGGFVYVDKTALVRELLRPAQAQYFLARPRRFGKSLLVSTLKAVFQGRRDLFRGLALDSSDYDWRTYPIIHLDMGSTQSKSVEEFELVLHDMLDGQARAHGVELPRGDLTPARRFLKLAELLAERSEHGKIVLLVDEYDKPMLHKLGTPDVRPFRDALKSFYSVIKTCEGIQRFALMTGISKFSKVSIFSDLNNLNDWTMDANAATLFGYTHEEVRRYFPERIHALAKANGLTDEGAFDEIIKWYDGYRFHHAAELVINPVSLGKCFQKCEFANYWAQTAMPTFLVDILKSRPLDFSAIDIDEETLGNYEPDRPKGVTLLFQTGYLTIKSFCQMRTSRRYTLRLPNLEVENSFLKDVVGAYTGQDKDRSSGFAFAASEALYSHDVPRFLKSLKAFFSDIPYDMTDRQNEQMWQTIVYVVLRSIGVNVDGEVKTNDGRIDMVVDLPNDVYIIEFKLDRPAAEAMEQIKGKDYAGKYALSKKRVTLVGISFSAAKRTIVEELVEELPHD